MRIKRISEDLEDIIKGPVDVDVFRVEQIMKTISDSMDSFSNSKVELEKILNEMESYKQSSKKENDQFDDAFINLQYGIDMVNQAVQKLDDVNSKLKDYNNNGRRDLY
jgi:exonuclease VII small subunit